MRTFNITVNGKTYQVQAEETTGGVSAPTVAVAAPAPVAVAVPAPVPVQVPTAPAAPAPAPQAPAIAADIAGGEPIKSSMPGTIVGIKVSAGQAVKKHEVLVILEAMKMENEIVTPRDGIVVQVAVDKGAAVNTGDTLVVIK
ncbi:MAG: acetyl-CoA carboxylase biotin carboxyl carrier protein subunit [Oscillospiraceae bacterium]|jgi:biotin carboxyl carrier protein|nr:acetyl-CoA carboxylase biotin carboxyl carrier protein subunit [Oscillospiraceae bacterium]